MPSLNPRLRHGLTGAAQVRRRAGPRLWLSAGWLGLLALAALLAPWIAPQDPLAQDLFLGRLPPFWVEGAEPGYWLGTDSLGRDVLSPHPLRRADRADRGAGRRHHHLPDRRDAGPAGRASCAAGSIW